MKYFDRLNQVARISVLSTLPEFYQLFDLQAGIIDTR